ncbi:unnamed protein product [Timema podura]|uniref:Uncharacterized protein n=1 Tax=Timema podura TaxID=61482 RepID=A0ABN7NFZ4_TIMPD|nr:unnamed protein product [Timema podura]
MGNVIAASQKSSAKIEDKINVSTLPPDPPVNMGLESRLNSDIYLGSTPSSFTEANLEDSQIGTIQSPGTVEDLHKKCKDLFPSVFEGAKLIVSNGINNHFQLSHTFTLSSEGGSGYRFGGTYVGTKMIGPNEAYPILQGDIDPRGNINSTVIHQFGPKLTSRLSVQIQNGKLSASQLTNDYKGDNCTCSLALANLDISKRAGVFVAHYLQSVSSNLALGSELVYQCGRNVPGGEMTMLSAVARYSLGDIVVSGALGAESIHTYYYQKVNEELQVGVELETNYSLKGSTLSVGYQYDLPVTDTCFRGTIDSNGTVGAVLEKKLNPLPFTFLLSGVMSHKQKQFKLGCGLIIG